MWPVRPDAATGTVRAQRDLEGGAHMVSEAETSLRDALGQKMDELSEALNGLDEEKAGQRAADAEWWRREGVARGGGGLGGGREGA